MYLSFPELREDPFRMKPDLKFLYLTKQHAHALAYVNSPRILTDGHVLLTGEIGSGKTLILERFVADLDSSCVTARIFQTQLNVMQFLQTLLTELGQKSLKRGKAKLLSQLKELVSKIYGEGRSIAIIIDEAQNLRPDVLEEIRLLSEIATGTDRCLTLILAGQPELADTFQSPKLIQLAERTPLHVHLRSLDRTEVESYVKHRLAVAGQKDNELIDAEGTAMIYELSSGIPRRVNILCQTAMLCAYGEDKHQIAAQDITAAAEELKWNENYKRPLLHVSRKREEIDSRRLESLELKIKCLQEDRKKNQQDQVQIIEQRDSKIGELESDLKFRIGLVDRLADSVKTLQDANAELRAGLRQEDRKKNQQDQVQIIEQRDSKIGELESDLKFRIGLVDRLADSVKTLQDANAELRAGLRNRDREITKLAESENHTSASLNEKVQSMQDLKRSLEVAEDRSDALESTLKQRDLTIHHLNEDLATSSKRLEYTKKKQLKETQLLQHAQSDQETNISGLRKQVSSGMETICTLRTEVTTWSDEYQKLQLELEENQAIVAQLKTRLDKANSTRVAKPARQPRLVSMRTHTPPQEMVPQIKKVPERGYFSLMVQENDKWVEHTVVSEYLTIGSSEDNDLTLKSDFVSPFHAVLISDRGGKDPVIEDLDSMNGTFVNAKRIQRVNMVTGDEVTIGKFKLKVKRFDATLSKRHKRTGYGGNNSMS